MIFMARIGLVVRSGVSEAVDLGKQLIEWAAKNGHEVLADDDSAKALGLPAGGNSEVIATMCNPVVALGGDGTLIGVGRYVKGRPPVMLGVNFGRLGFLTEIAPTELFSALKMALGGTAQYGTRTLLQCAVAREGQNVFSSQAVNDVVLHKGVFDKLMDIELDVDGHPVSSIRCDGLIISTPTGSTAYNLSAGGPIVYPSLAVAVVTPICSHSLTHRPIVLPNDAKILLKVPKYDGSIALSIDGQEGFSLKVGDQINITKSPNSVIFVRSPSQSYFDILRQKLNWGR
jgi:NAD+ kinase